MTGNKSVTAKFVRLATQSTVTFAAFGDYGRANDAEASVAALVKKLNPSIIVATGDNNYLSTGTTAVWDSAVGKYYGQYIR